MPIVQITHKSNGRSSTGSCHAPEHGNSHLLICRYTTRPPAIVSVKIMAQRQPLTSHITPSHIALSGSRLWLRRKLTYAFPNRFAQVSHCAFVPRSKREVNNADYRTFDQWIRVSHKPPTINHPFDRYRQQAMRLQQTIDTQP